MTRLIILLLILLCSTVALAQFIGGPPTSTAICIPGMPPLILCAS